MNFGHIHHIANNITHSVFFALALMEDMRDLEASDATRSIIAELSYR